VVLAGVVVTSALQSPHRVDRSGGGGRHPNIETVLQSKHDLHQDHDIIRSCEQNLNKSVEYTEHEYVHQMTSSAADGEGPRDAILSKDDYGNGMIYPPASPPAPDELPLRFLRAGKNDPIEGVRRYQATLQMRREQQIDTILREPSEKFHIIKQYYPHYCHYRGKNNEPCFYEQPPKTNLSELRKNGITLDKLLRHYTMVTEYQWQYIERDDLARSIYIIDLDGIRMTDFVGEAVDFVKKASAFSAQHYPERAGYVFVINVPGWFKLIWNVVKPIIDEDTLKKIYILRGKEEIRNAMQERIPLEHIPPEYGGTSVPLGQSPQEITLAQWMQHNNTLAEQQRTVCHDYMQCQFCTWVPARSY
jgi:CRAL/TRIO domain